jgi:hypothetical protein
MCILYTDWQDTKVTKQKKNCPHSLPVMKSSESECELLILILKDNKNFAP